MKEYNNRWFVFGKNDEYENLTNLALDRIIEIKGIDKEYEESDIDFQEYFDDFIGVTKAGNDLEVVKIWASPEQASYIKTKPLAFFPEKDRGR